jgi:hypothetical protein
VVQQRSSKYANLQQPSVVGVNTLQKKFLARELLERRQEGENIAYSTAKTTTRKKKKIICIIIFCWDSY